MPQDKTNTERLKTRSERELERLGEGSSNRRPRAASPPPPPAPPPKERSGTGRDNAAANARILAQQLKAKIDAARKAGNTTLADKLAARRAQLLKEAGVE